MRNKSIADIRRREKIIDIIAGVLIIPMAYVLTCLVFLL